MPLIWIKRKRGTLLLLDKRIRLVVKSYGEVSHKTLKGAVYLGCLGAVLLMFQGFAQGV